MKKLLLPVASVVLAVAVGNPKCPVDDGNAFYLGEIRNINGKTEKKYQCYTNGHQFWAAD